MSQTQDFFDTIGGKLISSHDHVDFGTMMSSPGIQWKGKNFVFLWGERMVFRVGKKFDADDFGLKKWEYLNPFKNKPPMKGWIVVGIDEKDHWMELAEIALAEIRG